MRTSASGLKTASRTLQVAADNIVNAHDHVPADNAPVSASAKGQKTGDGKDAPFDGFRPREVYAVTAPGGGVAAEVGEVDPSYRLAFAPGDPAANENGLVGRPNVDPAREMVRVRQAELLYLANVRMIEAEDGLLGLVVNDRA